MVPMSIHTDGGGGCAIFIDIGTIFHIDAKRHAFVNGAWCLGNFIAFVHDMEQNDDGTFFNMFSDRLSAQITFSIVY